MAHYPICGSGFLALKSIVLSVWFSKSVTPPPLPPSYYIGDNVSTLPKRLVAWGWWCRIHAQIHKLSFSQMKPFVFALWGNHELRMSLHDLWRQVATMLGALFFVLGATAKV